MTTSISSVFSKREMYANEIVFYSKHEVSLFGFMHQGGKFHETEYIISRNHLQMLLSQTKAGVEILWHIENLFVQAHAVPASLNLVEMFGTTQVFEAQKIELDVQYYENETGELVPTNTLDLLYVEEVIPFPNARQHSF